MHTDASPRFREIASDALRYWELRRPLYNLALIVVVALHFFAGWPASRAFVGWNTLFILIFLAVLANVCYCAVYVADLFVQFSGLREEWVQWRWALLLVGTIFAAVITHFFCAGVFSEPWTD